MVLGPPSLTELHPDLVAVSDISDPQGPQPGELRAYFGLVALDLP